jgi:hypothetical protein
MKMTDNWLIATLIICGFAYLIVAALVGKDTSILRIDASFPQRTVLLEDRCAELEQRVLVLEQREGLDDH